MPFTFSHPAIILPLSKYQKYFSLSALIVGSISPDVEYFIRMNVKAEYGHSIPGVFYFDLPLSVLILFIFHNLIKNQLIDNLPAFFRKRFISFTAFQWSNYFITYWPRVCLSIIIGAFSHIFWDNFTHRSGYFVKKLSLLNKDIHILMTELPVYNFLQHLSTIVGGGIILWFVYKMPFSFAEKRESPKVYYYWGLISLFTILIMLVKYRNGIDIKYYGNIIVSLISAFSLGLFFISIFFNLKRRENKH